MIRLFTYLTLAGVDPFEPTASDQYNDLDLSDLDVTMSNNYTIGETRDGLNTVVYDPKKLFPIGGNLIIHAGSLNKVGVGGVTRYFGPVLYRFFTQHLPICIFQQGSINAGMKCYKAYIVPPLPEAFASLATNMVGSPMNTQRTENNFPTWLSFELLITLDGVYFDIDNIAGASWNSRA